MADIHLQNCQRRLIWPPPGSGPADVHLVYTIGGASGNGIVRITCDGGDPPTSADLPTGTNGSTDFPGVTALYAHYMKTSMAPPQIDASFEPTPSEPPPCV